MTDQFLQEAITEIRMGVHKKHHPFRYVTLGTITKVSVPELRTVLLRQVTEDFKLRIYTDSRSDKVQQLELQPTASLLFYHPKKLLQIKILGITTRITDREELQRYYSGVQPNSRKDYTTKKAPGSELSNPDAVDYLQDEHYFTILEIDPHQLEFLQLKRPNHIRVAFFKEQGEWNGKFINP